MYLVHIAEKDVKAEFKQAKAGLENTLVVLPP